YQTNLPQFPKPTAYKPNIPNSELIKPWTYANPSPTPVVPGASGIGLPNADLHLVPARAISTGLQAGDGQAAAQHNDGDRLTVTMGGQSYNLWFDTDGVPNSAIAWTPTAGSNATQHQLRMTIADSDLPALQASNDLFLGGLHISFAAADYPATPDGLT